MPGNRSDNSPLAEQLEPTDTESPDQADLEPVENDAAEPSPAKPQYTDPETYTPPARKFNGYDHHQIMLQHVPVWKRGSKFYVRDGEGGGIGNEHRLDVRDWPAEHLKTLERVSIKETPDKPAKK